MADIVRRVGRKLKSVVRAVYVRVPLLPRLRHRYAAWKVRFKQEAQVNAASRDNLPALQALSLRRFDAYARASSLPVPAPADWPFMDVSVVTYNSARWIAPFLASLKAQEYPLDRIHLRFVDHGSVDDTVARLEADLQEDRGRFASVTLLSQANLGFGAGHDRAIREGQADYCLVTNLDLEYLPDTLTKLMRVALADTQGQVASWEVRQVPYEHPKYYDPVTWETNWSSHACILMRRSAYRQVGGYDQRLFMYAEDVELSYRFRSHGYALKYVPIATALHHTYEEAGQVKPMQYAGSTVGNVYLRWRYGNAVDRSTGVALYALLMAAPSPFPGARKALWRNAAKALRNRSHFLRGRGPMPAHFPFRAFDYEHRRDGAFWQVQPLSGDALPLVSVITRTYAGRGAFLAQAMFSVFHQTYPNVELLVVEDGGDTQQPLVRELAALAPAGCSVRFLAHPKLGRSSTGNAGLAAATGRYLMFLDDDDLLFSDHVETLMAVLQQDDTLSAAYALATEVYTDVDAATGAYTETALDTPAVFHQEWDHAVMQDHNFIPIQAIVFDRALYEERGGFDTELDQLEDWHLWLRYGYGRQFRFVPKTTSLFRSPANPDTRTARAMKLHEAYVEAKRRAMESNLNWSLGSVSPTGAPEREDVGASQ